MERLLRDAEALTGVEYDIDNLADVYSAIHAVQVELGIAGTTSKEAATTISGSAQMTKAAWENVVTAIGRGDGINEAIDNLVYSLSKFFENIVPVVESSLAGVGTLIAKIAPQLVQTLARTLIASIPDLLYAVYELVIGLAKGVYEGIKSLFFGTTNEVLEEQVDKIEQSTQNQNELTEAVKDTNKELKKSLAGFDELQILSSGIASNAEDSSLELNLGVDMGENTDTNELENKAQSVKKTFADLLPVLEKGFLAIGLILLATGNIPWGIGFIIASASLYSIDKATEGSYDLTQAWGKIEPLIPAISAGLVAIGIILLALGHIGFGIGFIVAGAVTYNVKEMNVGEWNESTATDKLWNVANVVAMTMMALGVILIALGQIGWGLAFVIAGALAKDYTEEQIDVKGIDNLFGDFESKLKDILMTAGVMMLAIGVILLMTGVGSGIGLKLILAGAAAVFGSKAMSDDFLKDVEDFCGKISGIWSKMCDGMSSMFNSVVDGVRPFLEWAGFVERDETPLGAEDDAIDAGWLSDFSNFLGITNTDKANKVLVESAKLGLYTDLTDIANAEQIRAALNAGNTKAIDTIFDAALDIEERKGEKMWQDFLDGIGQYSEAAYLNALKLYGMSSEEAQEELDKQKKLIAKKTENPTDLIASIEKAYGDYLTENEIERLKQIASNRYSPIADAENPFEEPDILKKMYDIYFADRMDWDTFFDAYTNGITGGTAITPNYGVQDGLRPTNSPMGNIYTEHFYLGETQVMDVMNSVVMGGQRLAGESLE